MSASRICDNPSLAEFRMFRDYLVETTGLALRDDRKEELLRLLQDRLSLFATDFESYFNELKAGGEGGPELHSLVSRLTVGETYFFRNGFMFDALRDDILPRLIERGKVKGRKLRFWSAGCASGEEPYSLAMLLLRAIPDIGRWDIMLLGTDINEKALAAARRGLYREWSFREHDMGLRRHYFTRIGNNWQLNGDVMRMVTFRYLNLADDTYPAMVTRTSDLDLILCRNVMIYFSTDLSQLITERFYRCLREGGCLLVGHSEHSDIVHPDFLRKVYGRAIVYERGRSPKKPRRSKNRYWEKGLKLRFRGSGEPRDDVIVHRPPEGAAERQPQRPEDTEETALFEQAISLYQNMRPEEALTLFREVLRINDRNERAHYMCALILADSGDLTGAELQLGELLEINSISLEGMYLLGMIHRLKGEDDKELIQLKKTIFLNRNFVLGHFQLGVHYLRLGREEQARRHLLNVLDILRGKAEDVFIDGIETLTVGGLRRSVFDLYPGKVPGEHRDGGGS